MATAGDTKLQVYLVLGLFLLASLCPKQWTQPMQNMQNKVVLIFLCLLLSSLRQDPRWLGQLVLNKVCSGKGPSEDPVVSATCHSEETRTKMFGIPVL